MNEKNGSHKLAKNTSRAAQYLGVSEGQLRKLRSLDDGPPWVRIGSRVAYLYADLDNWLQHQRVVPAGSVQNEL